MRRILGCGVLATVLLALGAQTVLAAEPPTVGGYATGGPAFADATAPSTDAQPAPPTDAQPPQRSRLPFTGLQVALMLLAGLGLVGLAIGLRRTASAAPG